MPTLRKATFPPCPACRKPGGLSLHARCPKETKSSHHNIVWIDLETGTEACAACGRTWSIEKAGHICNSCGAIFEGGDLWVGMAQEIVHHSNRTWIKRLGLAKGSLHTHIVGYDRCSFCGRWDPETRPERRPHAGDLWSSAHAAICDRCLTRYRRKIFHLRNKKDATCLFCYKKGAEVTRLFTQGRNSICNNCVARLSRLSPHTTSNLTG